MVVFGIGLLLAAQAGGQEAAFLKNDRDKQNYAVGVDLARKLKQQGYSAAQAEALTQGVRDELAGGKLLLTEEELQAALNAYQTELKQTRARFVRYVAQENKARGDAFLAENRKKAGVVSLPNGLQYKIMKQGSGARPTGADTVQCNYRGTLIDGTEFANSYREGKPASIPLKAAIPGLREALKLMPVGSKWQFFIPPELGYGEKGLVYGKRGAGLSVGPNETLIYEVELLAIK